MSVRKRTWTASGTERTAWVVDYVDTKGKRRMKTFKLKKEADQFAATATVEVREGVHVADRDTVTVAKAGALWITSGETIGLERSTINQRKRHLALHIEPFIGSLLLSKVTVPAVRDFEDRLRAEGRSAAMARKVLTSLGSIMADANERGLATRNPVRDIRGGRKGRDHRQERRQRARLEVGKDIPARDEVKALLGALEGNWRPLLITAVFTGMRSSELRGLRWQDIDFKNAVVNVTQRADEFGKIGAPKSEAGKRSISVPPLVVNTLKELKLRSASDSPFVFANQDGQPRSHTNIINKGLVPAMKRAGVVDGEGKAKYSGLHALRHFYASWCINRKEDGGLGLSPKMVQERLGHSSIVMTMDTYGHLFPRADDGDELADAARSLLL